MSPSKNSTLKCPSCGKFNPPGINYCENCGHHFGGQASGPPAGAYCPTCGTQNSIANRFCNNCGSALASAALPITQNTPAQATGQPPFIVFTNHDITRRQNWWPAIFLGLLLLFGCALWTSIIDVTPAMADSLPEWLQPSAYTIDAWQERAYIPPPVAALANLVKEFREGLNSPAQGNGQTAENATNNTSADPAENATNSTSADPADEKQTEYQVNYEADCSPYYFDKVELDVATTWNEWKESGGEFVVIVNNLDKILTKGTLFAGYIYNSDTIEAITECTIDPPGVAFCEGPKRLYYNPQLEISDIDLLVANPFSTSANEYCFEKQFAVWEMIEDEESNQAPEVVGPPMLSVSQATMCRKGPGSDYQAIGDLQVGETTEIIGQYAAGNWWVIENYGISGTCWIYGGSATTSGDVAALPYYDEPPLPQEAQQDGSQSDAANEESSSDGGGSSGNIWFALQNNLGSASVCGVSSRPASGGSWTAASLDGCILPGEQDTLIIPKSNANYDLKVNVCFEGSCTEYIESNVPISNGAAYPFKPN